MTTNSHAIRLFGAGAAALLLGIAADGTLVKPSLGAVAEAQDDQTLVILEEDEPQTTYPFLARTMSEQRLAELFFDRFFYKSTGGDLDSRVFAQGWKAKSPNLTLGIADGVKFSNGTPATFSDITFTLNDVYRREDLGHSIGAWYSRVFGDAQQITPMNGSIRFLVSMPDTGAEQYLLTTSLLSREALASTSGGPPNLEATKRQPVGTGPFFADAVIESFDDITLKRNPYRNGGEAPANAIQNMRLLYDQDAARQKELMEGSRADIWVAPPPAVLPTFRNQSDRFGVRPYDLKQWWYVAVNGLSGALGEPAVREALDHAVPRSQLLEKFGGESARLTSGPFLPGSAWEAADTPPTPEDSANVDQLMGNAGFAKSGGVWTRDGEAINLTLGVQADILDDFNDVVYGLTDAWESAGFRVRVRGIRSSDWRNTIEAGQAAGKYDLILGRWNADREEGVLELFRPVKDGAARQLNLFKYNNPAVEDTIKEFYAETSGPKREALMQKLHKTLHNDRPYLFLWTLQVQSVYRRDRVTGFRPTPFYFFSKADRLKWRASSGG